MLPTGSVKTSVEAFGSPADRKFTPVMVTNCAEPDGGSVAGLKPEIPGRAGAYNEEMSVMKMPLLVSANNLFPATTVLPT